MGTELLLMTLEWVWNNVPRPSGITLDFSWYSQRQNQAHVFGI